MIAQTMRIAINSPFCGPLRAPGLELEAIIAMRSRYVRTRVVNNPPGLNRIKITIARSTIALAIVSF